MKNHLHSILNKLRGRMFGFFVLCAVTGLALSLTPGTTLAQSGDTPPANTTIGNRASATYTDSGGNERTVTSNSVETVVQQVAAVTITPGVTKSVSPGGQVEFAHTLTNEGNGTDSFDLTTVEGSGAYDFDDITVYADADGDGVPDSPDISITETPSLAAGESYSFVIAATVPASATEGDSETIDVTGTSGSDNTVSNTQTNTAVISQDAVIDVIKAISPSSGAPGETVTVTLTFTNNGNTEGTNLVINDPLPVGFTYVDGSGQWSGSGSNLTDAADGDEGGIEYSYDSGSETVGTTIAELSAGQQGTLTFQVSVDSDTEGQTINNTANYTHDDLTDTPNTNTTTFQVGQDYGVAIVPPDTVSQGPAEPGTTVNFVNEFTNTGTVPDRYNITLENSDFPDGATFTLYRSDGSGNAVEPLTDSNNDGVPDVGPATDGDNFQVILQVALPSNASGGPYTVDKTATSIGDPNESATHTDELTAVSESTVDVTNNEPYNESDPAPGQGTSQTGEASPVSVNDADPGSTTSFTLVINNIGGSTDNYDLLVGHKPGGSLVLNPPDGYSVEFREGDTSGPAISETGPMAAGASKKVAAVVTVPGDADPGQQSIFFGTQSSATEAADVKHDAIDVGTERDLSLVASQNAQIAPGGSKVYPHTLTNEGNVDENDGTNSTIGLDLQNSTSGFTSVVYVDNNGDGAIDSGDEQVVSAGNYGNLSASVGTLAPGDQVQLLVKVTAGTGVSDGTTNTITLTAQGSGQDVNGVPVSELTAEVKDITTVVSGNLEIQKLQSATQGSGYTTDNINADPGDIVYYRIIVTNNGSEAVTDVNISDGTPAYTTQEGSASVGSPGVLDDEPGDGSAGSIKVSAPSLGAGESFTIEFAVEIDS